MASQTIGRYEIRLRLGRGGMATVYHAYDPRFKRDVAIKVLPPEFLHDETFRTRFEREAQTIAALSHPAIVPVYDYGEESGQPYLVMAFMEGGSLADQIKRGPLDLDEIARIVSWLAPALDEAHAEGVIHRDIKPANILFDRRGLAYLSDFGIVKLSEATAQLTGSGIVGTPAYMAPEMSDEGGLSPLIDIYALGVTLFEMVTGKLPYRADTPMGVLMAHGLKPVPDARALRPGLPDGLQVVIERAMAKDPAGRYQTAGALAEALNDVIAGTGVRPAETHVQAPLETEFVPLEPAPPTPPDVPTMDVTAIPTAKRQADEIEAAPRIRRRRRGIAWWMVRALGAVIGMVVLCAVLGIVIPLMMGVPGPGQAATKVLVSLMNITGTKASVLSGHTGYTRSVAWSPDGTMLASGSSDRTVILWDTETAEQFRTLSADGGIAKGVAWSPDGTKLAFGSWNGTVILWNTATGIRLHTLGGDAEAMRGVAFSPDGTILASGSSDGAVLLWNPATGDRLRVLRGHTDAVRDVAWSPDGTMLASGSSDGTMILWDSATFEPHRTLMGHPGGVESLAWSPDETALAAGTWEGTVIIWDAETGEQIRTLSGHTNTVTGVAWSPDGTTIASGSEDFTVILWDATTGEQLRTLRGHVGGVLCVAWSPDGTVLASGSHDKTVILWTIPIEEP